MATTRELPVEHRDNVLKYVPGWEAFRGYERRSLPRDVIAGLR